MQNTIQLRSDDGGAHFIPLKGDPTGDDFHTLVDRSEEPRSADPRRRPGDAGDAQRRQDLEQLVQPADRPILSRLDRQPLPVPDLWRRSRIRVRRRSPSRSDSKFDGITMTQFHEVTAGGESDEIAPDPDDPDIVYGGRVDRLDLKSGQTRNVDPTLAFPGRISRRMDAAADLRQARPRALFRQPAICSGRRNGGQTWTPISPDLTRPDPGVPATLDRADGEGHGDQGAAARRHLRHRHLADPRRADLGRHRRRAHLANRRRRRALAERHAAACSSPGRRSGSSSRRISIPNVAYAAIDRHRLDDQRPLHPADPRRRPHLDRDHQRTCRARADPIPSMSFARIRFGAACSSPEPSAASIVSFDDGDNWQPLNSGLPTTSVRDITIHGDDLVIATHGRGFYVLDDIVPLRALAGNAEPVHPPLSRSRPRYRVQRAELHRHADAQGRAAGAQSAARGDDRLCACRRLRPVRSRSRSTTRAGALVNRFSSTDPVKPLDLSKLPVAPEWVVCAKAARCDAGPSPFRVGPPLCKARRPQGRGHARRACGRRPAAIRSS